jgi:3-oxoacyl-[acyl-carrier protein] reductase
MKRVAFVTGAGGGIGRAVALGLSTDASTIVLADLDEAGLEETNRLLGDMGGSGRTAVLDVTDRVAVRSLVDETVREFGPIAVLVNCAGTLTPTRVIDITEDEWDGVVNVNLKGTFLCSQAVLPGMEDLGWGRIVNLSSSAGKSVSTVGGAHYTAAKAGVLGFTRHLAKEVADIGVTVNAVCPGLIDTQMVRNTINEEKMAWYANSFPIQRLGTSEEVATVVCFLASDGAAYITGVALDINGGDLMV